MRDKYAKINCKCDICLIGPAVYYNEKYKYYYCNECKSIASILISAWDIVIGYLSKRED